MSIDERLPQHLLLILAGTREAAIVASQLAWQLRLAGVPALLAAPRALDAPADLRLEGNCEQARFFNKRSWVKRLHPDLVLGADLSMFTRAGLLAARSEGLKSLLWSACGQRLPWWTRLLHQCLPRIENAGVSERHRSEPLARYLRAAVLGLGAGGERLLLSPLAAAGHQALAVKRS